MNKAEREDFLREIFQEICGDKAKARRIIMEPPGVGEEHNEFFMIKIEYFGDENFVSGKHDEIWTAIKERIFWPNSDNSFFEDADDWGEISLWTLYID